MSNSEQPTSRAHGPGHQSYPLQDVLTKVGHALLHAAVMCREERHSGCDIYDVLNSG